MLIKDQALSHICLQMLQILESRSKKLTFWGSFANIYADMEALQMDDVNIFSHLQS